MAENTVANNLIVNSCCNVWKDKYSQLQQKFAKGDDARTALRKGIELYERQLAMMQAENQKVKKAYEEARLQTDNERKEKVKESAARVSLENEISALKSEILKLSQKGGSETEHVEEELKLLRVHAFDGEKEINRLQEQLQKERTEADAERMKSEAEKKRADEAWKSAEAEKSRDDEELTLLQARLRNDETEINQLREHLQKERARADLEKQKADEVWKTLKIEKSKAEGLQADKERGEKVKESMRHSLEDEISSLKSQILLLQQKGGSGDQNLEEITFLRVRVSEMETEISRLKELLDKEITKADSEKKKAEAEKKKANEVWETVKTEKRIADEQRRLADGERKKAEEYGLRLEKLQCEADDARSKLVLEISKYKEANKKLESERRKVIKEKKQAEEQRKLAEMSRKNALEEKCRADRLNQQLEEDQRRYDKLKKEMEEAVSSRKLVEAPVYLPVKQMNGDTVELKGRPPVEKLKDKSDELKAEKAKQKLGQIKQKANQEKKRADLEMRKAAEQRKVAEALKEKAMEEKARADKLAQQLEENKRKTEDLRKEMQDLVSPRSLTEAPVVPLMKNMSADAAKMKLLRKQLKLEKMQVKHAKQVAKLEKDCKNIAEEELYCLKLEFAQFSHRLGLCNCFAVCNVGKAHLEKNGNMSLKRKFVESEACLVHLQNRNELLKPSCAAMDAPDCFKEIIECTAPMLHISGNCTESTSGIASKMEPLLRGSNRKNLHSSAIDSSMASFSDRQLVGSQERGAFSITKSAERAKEMSNPQLPISRLSSEVNRRSYNENIAMVDDNSVKSPLRVDAVGRSTKHSKKRKRLLNAVESFEHLYSEGKKWHLKVADNLSTLQYVLEGQMDKPLEEGRYLIPKLLDDMYTEQDQHHKKRRAFLEEAAVRRSCNSNERKEELGTKAVGDADVCFHAFADNVTEATLTCNNELDKSGRKILESFEQVVDGDYMKLLDLDNSVDEESYRVAIEMPLSPTLPEIEFQSSESDDVGGSKCTMVDSLDCSSGGLTNGNDYMMPCCSSDVRNEEINSSKLKLKASGNSQVHPLFQKKEGTVDSFEILMNDEMEKSSTIHAKSACASQIRGSGVELGISDSGDKGTKTLWDNNFGSAHDDLCQYCVVFSDINDSGSLSKIFCTTRRFETHCCMFSQTDHMVRNTLSALLEVENLLPKEKVCVFVSVLLHSFSGIALKNLGNLFDSNFFHFLDIFAGQMHKVMSNVETRRLFSEICDLDEVLTLIEDFLIDGRVLVHADVDSETPDLSDPRVNICLDSTDIPLTFCKASCHQLLCGAITLASLCAVFDHIGFICEASYSVCRRKKIDSSMLTFLHVFAYICGYKYFTLSDYSLVMTTMKSLVTFLERENLSTDSAFSRQYATMVWPKFPSCTKCPFSEGAISMEALASLLLKKLQNYALCDLSREELTESVHLSNSEALSWKKKTKSNSGHGEALCVLCKCGSVSCCLHKFGKITCESKPFPDGTLCNLRDALSLLELVASNMSWDWTCCNIVGQLLKMFESCVVQNSLAAILILLGQMARLGIDAKGYEDTVVENIRGRLCAFLSQSTSRKVGLPVQIATVSALLGMISLNFEELVKSNGEFPAVVSLSIPGDCIRKWFSLLSNEQMSLSFRLLTASVPSCRNV